MIDINKKLLNALIEIEARERERIEFEKSKNPNGIIEASIWIIAKEAIDGLSP